MVYGLISRPLHRALPFPQVPLAFAVFTMFMLGCAIAWERFRRPGTLAPGTLR